MAQNPKLKIEVEAVDKATKTLEEAARAFRELSNSLKGTAKAAEEAQKRHSSFLSILRSETRKAGRYVDQLNNRFRALSDSIFNLKTAIAAALGGLTLGKLVKDGIEFNAQLQTAKLGLSALITSSYQLRDAQGEVLSGMEAFKAAQAEAERLYREILDRAMRTASTSKELLETFQAILPYAAQTGMSLQQALNMSEAFVNAAKALGLGFGQAAQEARALFMGDIDQNAQLLRALNITKEMVDTWREQGRLYNEVMKKLQPFVEASQEFADTWEGVTSSISDLISMLEGSIFKDTFRIMNEALKEVRDKLEGIINNEDELDKISKEIANKFLDAAEAIIIASDQVYQFGKTVYDFVNSHRKITEFGVLGYFLLGKKGALLGTIIGGITEIAEKSKDAFPSTVQILKKQPNTRNVIGISPSIANFERPENIPLQIPPPPKFSTPINLPEVHKTTPGSSNRFLKIIENLRKKINEPAAQTKEIKIIEKIADFSKPEKTLVEEISSSLVKAETLPQKITETLLNKKYTYNISTTSAISLVTPNFTREMENIKRKRLKLYAEYKKETQKLYSEILKTTAPQKWKEQALRQLQEWYDERKKILGKSVELQKIYEHKKLEIEKEAHEQEQKLYFEKLKQTSKWKAGILKALDDLSKKWGDTNQQMYDLTTQTFQALENSLETLFFDAMRGKLKSLGDYVNSFLTSVESAIAGIAAQGVAHGIIGALGFNIKTAANGDIFPGHFIPLQAFAGGGVVNRPTLGLIGEGKYPEAIVPLPDGRSIPVKFEGKSNGQANIEIVLVDDRSKIPPPQIGKQQVVLWVAEDYMQNGILRKVIKA